VAQTEREELWTEVIDAEGNLHGIKFTFASMLIREDCVRLSSCLSCEPISTLSRSDSPPVIGSRKIDPFSMVTAWLGWSRRTNNNTLMTWIRIILLFTCYRCYLLLSKLFLKIYYQNGHSSYRYIILIASPCNQYSGGIMRTIHFKIDSMNCSWKDLLCYVWTGW